MKKLTTLILMTFTAAIVWGQTEDLTINTRWYTSHTGGTHAGKWTKMAECTIAYPWQDFGTTFEIFGNGSGTSRIYYGKLIARFKNQNSTAQPINNWKLVLIDSNIGTENVKAVRTGTKVELFVRIPEYHTCFYFRRILNGSSPITALAKQPFLSTIPPGDLTIDCLDGDEPKDATDNLVVSGKNSPYLRVSNTDATKNSNAIIKAAYAYDGSAKTRSARIELGTHDIKGGSYYGKVWSIESSSTSTWANSPEFKISNGNKKHVSINYLGNMGIGKSATTVAKLDVAGTIRATEIKVEANGQTADFVFEEEYNLRDLQEVETFIQTNKHLPEIPSAATMEENGVNLAEMNKLLLLKIEELTLYTIQKEKEVQQLKEKGERQEDKVESLEERLAKIEAMLLEK